MATTTTTSDDFSFPNFTVDSVNFPSGCIDSPPLWQLSPVASPASRRLKLPTSKDHEDQEISSDDDVDDDYKDCFATIPSLLKCSSCRRDEEEEDEELEEKMDMLWEDFNEETMKRSDNSRLDDDDDDQVVNMGCGQGLRLSKPNGTVTMVASPRKRTGNLLVFVKVLKKLFLIRHQHNSHRRSVKNNHNSHQNTTVIKHGL